MGRSRKESQSTEPAALIVPRILNECQRSEGSHPRAIKQLVECRKNAPADFLEVWIRCLQPLFLVSKREPVAERIVNLVTTFTAYWDEEHDEDCTLFFEAFLSTLLDWAEAAHKTVRFRACQMISGAVSKLEPSFIVKDELWDRMTSSMQMRMQDRNTSVRVFAANALSRLVDADDIHNDPTVQAYRKALASDSSAEVRKMVVKCMPVANATVSDVVQRIADASESVRKASYQAIGERLSITGLSITQRAMTIERGLAERVPAVRAECEKLLELWLRDHCDGDPLILLRFLDVETYEKAGEMAMLELLRKNLIKSPDTGLGQFLDNSGNQPYEDRRMNAEEALFWRVLCTHIYSEAKAKGCAAATTGGAEAVLNAAIATEQNEYLESILLPTVADFVRLLEAHLHKGSAAWFAARQLLLLAKLMDFTDSSSRKDAGILLQRLLRESTPSEEQGETDNIDPQEWVGDGISLGGEESWANAVVELAHHVHASAGEFEEVLAAAVAEICRPCREGGADVKQWLHCLAVTGLLLENIPSLHVLGGRPIEPEEIVHSLLLPAVKHLHPEVQRAGVRCLGIFCGLERSPSPRAVEQLRLSLHCAGPQVQKMALKAMFDLILCHGAVAIDRAVGPQPDVGLPTSHAPELQIPDFTWTAAQQLDHGILRSPVLEHLKEWLYCEILIDDGPEAPDYPSHTTSIAAEGFAKVLLKNRRFPDVQLIQESIVEELLVLYFSDSTTHSPRLKQCLAVFFRTWCSLSADNKRCISTIFVPVMRKKWPGIHDTREKPGTVLIARTHATQVADFMLHLLQLPLTAKATRAQKTPSFEDEIADEACDDALDEGHETLAIRICLEVKRHGRHFKSLSMALKTYSLKLSQVATLLQFSASHQEKIKALLYLLPRLTEWLPSGENTPLKKALRGALARLKKLDLSPDKGLTDEELELFMVRMGFHEYFTEEPGTPEPPSVSRTAGGSTSRRSVTAHTSIPASTRSRRTRTEAQTARSQIAAGQRRNQLATNTARKNLSSVYESTSDDSTGSPVDESDDESADSTICSD